MNTKHSNTCKRVFKNYDVNCPRCQELANGSQARDGWQKAYYSNKRLISSYTPRTCTHGESNLNPGGYCNVCGAGSDFS